MKDKMTSRKTYYERNRVSICRKRINESMPNSIKEIGEQIPDKVSAYYEEFPYEVYGEPIIKRKLRHIGIKEFQLEYQECYSAAMQAYLYSIHRCALCNYSHTEFYIRKMINIAIICGIVIAHEGRNICKYNGFRQINLDAEEQVGRW